MPVHVPGPELLSSVPFKVLGGKGKLGRKGVYASLNLTAMVDMMTMLVIFLLITFSATGELLLMAKNLTLPDAANEAQLFRAPIITISRDSILFNGEDMQADPQMIALDTSLEYKIVTLYERLGVEHKLFLEKNPDPEKRQICRTTKDKKQECMDLLGMAIVQADRSVDAKVLNRVTLTLRAANYPNIMFAVNQRSRKS